MGICGLYRVRDCIGLGLGIGLHGENIGLHGAMLGLLYGRRS